MEDLTKLAGGMDNRVGLKTARRGGSSAARGPMADALIGRATEIAARRLYEFHDKLMAHPGLRQITVALPVGQAQMAIPLPAAVRLRQALKGKVHDAQLAQLDDLIGNALRGHGGPLGPRWAEHYASLAAAHDRPLSDVAFCG